MVTLRSISVQGRAVLEALAAGDGPLSVAAVLALIRRPEVAAPVARASLSRTLRRLWAAGLVELVTGHATRPTLTEQAAYWRSLYVAAQASPDATYQDYCRRFGDHHGSAAGLQEALRAQVACYGARVRRVALTDKGRETVQQSFSG
jgi:hypothetical protein